MQIQHLDVVYEQQQQQKAGQQQQQRETFKSLLVFFFGFLKIEPQIENQDGKRASKGNHNEKWVKASIENCSMANGEGRGVGYLTHTAVACESEIEFDDLMKAHQKCSLGKR